MSAKSRVAQALLLTLAVTSLALVIGCAPSGPTYIDGGSNYTIASVNAVLSRADAGSMTNRPTSEAAGLRHAALVALRRRGGAAASAADLITRTFPSDTRSVPVYVEWAVIGGKRSIVIVEATGPKNGRLNAKRLWVLDGQGNIIFASTGK